MIKIATVECFTQGNIGREIHSLAQSYTGDFGNNYSKIIKETIAECNSIFDFNELSLSCSLFIPTLDGVKDVLRMKNPLKPIKLIKGIKVYDDEGDKKMALAMAEALGDICPSQNILIATTAGIGYGGIAIMTDEVKIITSSDCYANLIECKSEDLNRRSISGIEKILKILIYYLNDEIEKIESLNDVEIIFY